MRIASQAETLMSAGPSLDPETERAVHLFMERLAGRYAVGEGLLFGSRARRTHKAESDADLAIVLRGTEGNRSATARDMAGIAFDVMMETGILVEALPLWAADFRQPSTFSNPALIEIIRREGLRL